MDDDEKTTPDGPKNLRCPKCGGGRLDGDTPYCSCKSPFQICTMHALGILDARRRRGEPVDLDEIARTACEAQGHPQLVHLVRDVLK